MGAHALGLVFFGWGLLLAVTSVFVAPRLKRRFGVVPTLVRRCTPRSPSISRRDGLRRGPARRARRRVIVAGGFLGVVNTVLTEPVMRSRRSTPDRLLRLFASALRRRRDRAVPGGQARRVGRAGRAVLRRRGRGRSRPARPARRPAPLGRGARGRGGRPRSPRPSWSLVAVGATPAASPPPPPPKLASARAHRGRGPARAPERRRRGEGVADLERPAEAHAILEARLAQLRSRRAGRRTCRPHQSATTTTSCARCSSRPARSAPSPWWSARSTHRRHRVGTELTQRADRPVVVVRAA